MVISTIKKLLNGDTPQFTKGEQIWDYLYSGDAANAMYLLGAKGHGGKTYCLGSGNARPLRDYVIEIRDLIDRNIKLDFGAIPYHNQQVMHLCADITDLKRDVGYQPAVEFKNGIMETLKWITANGSNGKKVD